MVLRFEVEKDLSGMFIGTTLEQPSCGCKCSLAYGHRGKDKMEVVIEMVSRCKKHSGGKK